MAGRYGLIPFETPRLNMWDDPWGGVFSSPARLFDQNFAMGLFEDDLFPATPFRGWYLRPHRGEKTSQESSGTSEVSNTDNEFRVNVDVSHFKPEEIEVKTADNKVIVHGLHEERPDQHGLIKREFFRSYNLPKNVDTMAMKSSLSADGVLTVHAPKLALEAPKEQIIPIKHVPDQLETKSQEK